MSTQDSKPEIDFLHLKQYVGDDIALTAEVFGLFKHQVDMWQKLLNASADDESWVSVMHSLKGSARAVGAMGWPIYAKPAKLWSERAMARRSESPPCKISNLA